MNDAMAAVLEALRLGPMNTLQLQALCPTTHAAKPIWDLRQAGYVITRRSLPNRVAEYRLIGRVLDVPVEAGSRTTLPASTRAPRTVPAFGDLAAIRAMRRG